MYSSNGKTVFKLYGHGNSPFFGSIDFSTSSSEKMWNGEVFALLLRCLDYFDEARNEGDERDQNPCKYG